MPTWAGAFPWLRISYDQVLTNGNFGIEMRNKLPAYVCRDFDVAGIQLSQGPNL
jgi:hypothetical protein